MKTFNILEVHGKIQVLGGGGVHKKPIYIYIYIYIYRGGLPKKGDLDSLQI